MGPSPVFRPMWISRHLSKASGLLLAGALVVAGGGLARGAGVQPTLYVNYTMGCTFSITDDSGKPVTSIAPGPYQVLVASPADFGSIDLSGINDMMACKGSVHFQLTGPGVSLSTTLDDGDNDQALLQGIFQPSGTYVAQDLTPGASARASFSTTANGTPATPTVPYSTSGSGKGITTTPTNTAAGSASTLPLRGVLDATLSATGKVTLKLAGKPVSTVKAGKYVIAVVDQSKKSGFVVQELHKLGTVVSSAPFTGKRSTAVALTKGQWVFYASVIGTKSHFTVTS